MRGETPGERTYFQDEMRCGTRTETGRRWMPVGERPCCPVKIGYEFVHLFVAICPATGDMFAMFLPNMTARCFTIFQEHFHEHLQKEGIGPSVLLVLDRATGHRFAENPHPDEQKLLFIPVASPELNPVERFFKELRKDLKFRVFHSLRQTQDRIEIILKKYWERPELIIKTTNFHYLNTSM